MPRSEYCLYLGLQVGHFRATDSSWQSVLITNTCKLWSSIRRCQLLYFLVNFTEVNLHTEKFVECWWTRTMCSPMPPALAIAGQSWRYYGLVFVFLWVLGVLFCFVFWDRVSLCSPGCPGTHFVDQAGLELRNLPASASRVLGLKACATMPGKPVSSVDSKCLDSSHIWILKSTPIKFSQVTGELAHLLRVCTMRDMHSGGRDRWISQASLVYKASSRTARATQRNPVSEKNQCVLLFQRTRVQFSVPMLSVSQPSINSKGIQCLWPLNVPTQVYIPYTNTILKSKNRVHLWFWWPCVWVSVREVLGYRSSVDLTCRVTTE
jgi:hypothetical protein